MVFVKIFLELVTGYIALLLTTKFLGKTQISQITPFDFVSALVLGEFVGAAVFQKNVGVAEIAFAVFAWGGLIYLTEVVTQKSRRLRNFLEGKPSLIICQGMIIWKELKSNHLDIDQLMQLLRAKDVFSLQDVEYAVLENDGTISVLKKSNIDVPTRQDLHLSANKVSMPAILISDGQVRLDVLKQCGLDNNWLHQQLQKQDTVRVNEICYAEWREGQDLYIQKYN
ncbi:DUF421 domain-containing protein [Bacillus sp. 165]|uniref:DUF421 domain-containing protein n=1 Tax=Bacillus sp. 165 TaxID=1529117 RepID=UPI001AD9B64E|nr:DUF421 domain-containing protein [Bacillus sp. 165]MBO9128364.1 DUF421 domain-containing protein [Bacillus sp. 165]